MTKRRITVIGLGPAGPELVTAAALTAINQASSLFVRTTRHPAASVMTGAASFDALYEQAETLEEVYEGIVEALIVAACEAGEVVYAVPGSPRVAERSVDLLVGDTRVTNGDIEVVVVPALSFLDLAWVSLGVDPFVDGVRVVDGHRFTVQAAGQRGPLLVAQCDSAAVLSEVKLSVGDETPEMVWVLNRLGLVDESVVEIAWEDLDRVIEPDHLTSLYIPELAAPVAAELVDLVELVRTLREQCPWDREQTHASLTRYLLEETYELLEAIEALDETSGEGYEHLEEELGDVLFQVLFHATLGAEAGQFTLADVARTVNEKLTRRHPHVFAGLEVADNDEIARNWEQIKREEKGRMSVMEGIPGNLPSLLYAHKVQRKATAIGVEVETPASVDMASLVDDEGVGNALFVLVAAARRAKVDPESALRATSARFRKKVEQEESSVSTFNTSNNE
ncbi:MAG: MazG family protein [Acidimicrobiales bacterium]